MVVLVAGDSGEHGLVFSGPDPRESAVPRTPRYAPGLGARFAVGRFARSEMFAGRWVKTHVAAEVLTPRRRKRRCPR
jgi:hypothetical protein